jgi:valyl-tRNA synthetase
MDLRPQGPEIIRTWLFATVVRAGFEHDAVPWRDTTINGWVLDPDRKKMSKSIGNVVTPMPLVEEHGPDALRYWSLSGRPGVDTAVDFGQMKVGRRLAIKLLNASKFALGVMGEGAGSAPDAREVTDPLDLALLVELAATVEDATASFGEYDYARALERTERFFWSFCDDYVELVKQRAYGARDKAGQSSARASLAIALDVLLRLFAPHLPFVTEEVWSWWREGSVHRAPWPDASPLHDATADAAREVLAIASDVVGEVRKAKTASKRSLRTEAKRVVVRDGRPRLMALEAALDDVRETAHAREIELVEADGFAVEVELVTDEA